MAGGVITYLVNGITRCHRKKGEEYPDYKVGFGQGRFTRESAKMKPESLAAVSYSKGVERRLSK